MKPHHAIPFFLLAIVIALPLASSLVAHSEVVPLEYYNTGKELKPGYSIELETHGIGVTATLLGAFTDAVGCVGDVCFGVTGTDGVIPVHVYLYINGEKKEIGSVWAGKAEYDTMWKLYLYCPGETVGGIPTDENHAVLEVYNYDYNIHKFYVVDITNNEAPDLRGYYEHTPGVTSWFRFSDPQKFKDCGNYIGDNPGEDEGNNVNHGPSLNLDLNKLALYGIGGIMALGLVAILKRR